MRRKYQVFVSSTYEDLVEERKEVTQALLENDCIPAGMELFPASNKKQWDIIKKVIDDSDYYLLIIAGRYGSTGKDDSGNTVSYTEMEYDYALQSGKPIIAFIHKEPDLLPLSKSENTKLGIQRLNKFKNKVKTGREVAYWTNKDNLKSKVILSIRNTIKEYPSGGWIKEDTLSDNKDAFKQKYSEIYPLLIEYRDAAREADNVKLNEATEKLQKMLQDLYYLSERYRYSDSASSTIASEIVDKWNEYSTYFTAYFKASDRMSTEAQQNAKTAEMKFGAMVDLIVKNM